MKNLIHFGCSFAVGNGIPKYLIGLDSGQTLKGSKKDRFQRAIRGIDGATDK